MNIVTGATGLLGSHVVEQLVRQGKPVRALIRQESDASFLESQKVEIRRGSLLDSAFLDDALSGADTIYHTAAKVGEWGPWQQFLDNIIHPVESLLAASRRQRIRRVVHVSSITVYGHPLASSFPIDETMPTGQRLWKADNYIRAKLRTEELWNQYEREVTILRPTWFFGPRDRTTLPRVLAAFGNGKIAQVGDGSNKLNVLYAGDVANAVVRAGASDKSVGKAYNISNPGELTQKEFLGYLADSLGFPRVKKSYGINMAYIAGYMAELIGKTTLLGRPPHITRYSVALMLRSNQFSIQRAKADLGWEPKTLLKQAVDNTLAWRFGSSGMPGPLARK
mgnify:CR=1 FL=1